VDYLFGVAKKIALAVRRVQRQKKLKKLEAVTVKM
jgi:hypothetical protein